MKTTLNLVADHSAVGTAAELAEFAAIITEEISSLSVNGNKFTVTELLARVYQRRRYANTTAVIAQGIANPELAEIANKNVIEYKTLTAMHKLHITCTDTNAAWRPLSFAWNNTTRCIFYPLAEDIKVYFEDHAGNYIDTLTSSGVRIGEQSISFGEFILMAASKDLINEEQIFQYSLLSADRVPDLLAKFPVLGEDESKVKQAYNNFVMEYIARNHEYFWQDKNEALRNALLKSTIASFGEANRADLIKLSSNFASQSESDKEAELNRKLKIILDYSTYLLPMAISSQEYFNHIVNSPSLRKAFAEKIGPILGCGYDYGCDVTFIRAFAEYMHTSGDKFWLNAQQIWEDLKAPIQDALYKKEAVNHVHEFFYQLLDSRKNRTAEDYKRRFDFIEKNCIHSLPLDSCLNWILNDRKRAIDAFAMLGNEQGHSLPQLMQKYESEINKLHARVYDRVYLAMRTLQVLGFLTISIGLSYFVYAASSKDPEVRKDSIKPFASMAGITFGLVALSIVFRRLLFPEQNLPKPAGLALNVLGSDERSPPWDDANNICTFNLFYDLNRKYKELALQANVQQKNELAELPFSRVDNVEMLTHSYNGLRNQQNTTQQRIEDPNSVPSALNRV